MLVNLTTIQSLLLQNRLRYSLRLETRARITKKYTRNSVEEVYAYIKADIEEGLTYVTSDYDQPKYHFNKAAANAFASRFAVIGEWDKVITVSNDLETSLFHN
jgi:uncharacterized protein with HEPN domain